MRKSRYSPAVRAAALADLKLGEQPAVVAAKYGIDAAQVRVWKQRYVTDAVTAHDTMVRRPTLEQTQLSIAELVLKNLEAKLIATQRLVEYVANNPAWLETQTAADVGDLFERIDRSAVTILDRMASSRSAAAHPIDPGEPDQS